MKFLIYLVLIIVVLINNFYICNGKAVVSIKLFQYDQYSCRGESGSSLGPMSTGSFNMEEMELGNIDGGNSQSASYSSAIASCDNIEIEAELFSVIGACIPNDREGNYYYITYRVDYTNGTISKTTYVDNVCLVVDTFNPVQHFRIDQCVDSCTSGPYLYTIIDSAEIVIPKNSLVQFDYTGKCGCCWKDTFTQIKYTPINKCLLTSETTSYQVTCNSTHYEEFNSFDQNNCLRYHQETILETGVQFCTTSNQMIFCNV